MLTTVELDCSEYASHRPVTAFETNMQHCEDKTADSIALPFAVLIVARPSVDD